MIVQILENLQLMYSQDTIHFVILRSTEFVLSPGNETIVIYVLFNKTVPMFRVPFTVQD